eukprot:288800_1
MFLILLSLSLFNQFIYAQITFIAPNEIWYDDFKNDYNAIYGWWIFNYKMSSPRYYYRSLEYYGINNKPYHGPFTKYNNHQENWMIRKFIIIQSQVKIILH